MAEPGPGAIIKGLAFADSRKGSGKVRVKVFDPEYLGEASGVGVYEVVLTTGFAGVLLDSLREAIARAEGGRSDG